MTEEALKNFGRGEAFINLKGTTASDWINLIEQCAKVGIDLNERAINVSYAPPGYKPAEAFVCYAENHITKTNTYLKCSGDKLITWSTNILGLPIYNFTPSEMPVFEI